jgi:hypothetical protein
MEINQFSKYSDFQKPGQWKESKIIFLNNEILKLKTGEFVFDDPVYYSPILLLTCT